MVRSLNRVVCRDREVFAFAFVFLFVRSYVVGVGIRGGYIK